MKLESHLPPDKATYRILVPQVYYEDISLLMSDEPLGSYYQTPSRWSRLTWRFKSFYYRACDAWGVLTGKYEIKDDWS